MTVESNAAPALLAAQQELARNKLQDSLEKKIESRPEKDQLVEQNILKGSSSFFFILYMHIKILWVSFTNLSFVMIEGTPALQAAAEALKKSQLCDQLATKIASRPTQEDEKVQKFTA